MQTKQLTDFVHALTYEDLPPQAVEMGKMCVEDLLGVALAGSVRPQGAIWNAYFTKGPQPQVSTAWNGSFQRYHYAQAAALNAAYGHLLDMDDVHNASIVHLGAVTIPTALALGQLLHRSGREVLAAIAAGYEVGARVGEAINPGSYYYWHTTGVVGALASAAVAGKLLRLSPGKLLHAMGSAGTQAAGLWEFLEDGAMSKSLHTANATLCGIRSAELAGLGLTGASKILEGDRGLVRALTPDHDMDALTRSLDAAHLKILGNSFKPYACCRHTHSANYAMERLMTRRHFTPADIQSITDRTYAVAKQTIDCPAPATPYAYKFSVQYCIAAMLLRGDLMDEAFSPAAVADPRAHALMEKISVVLDEDLERQHRSDPNRWPHLLELRLKSGEVLEQQVDYPLGDFNNPFDWTQADGKFYAVTDGVIPYERAQTLCARIRSLDGLTDVDRLFAD